MNFEDRGSQPSKANTVSTLLSHPFLSRIGLDITPLVPDEYAAYRSAIGDALAFFVNRLPDRRRQAFVREQLAMPADAPAANRLVALLHHCPTLHKLGQVVARHRSLAPALPELPLRSHRERLRRLSGVRHADRPDRRIATETVTFTTASLAGACATEPFV